MPEVRRETLTGLVGGATADIAASVAQGAGVIGTQVREMTRGDSTGAGSPSSSYHRFTHRGPITIDADPDTPYVSPSTVQLVGVRCDVAAGSDDGSIGIYIDGTLVKTMSWTGAPDAQQVALDELLVADATRLTVGFTAGTGFAAVSLRFEMI